MRQKWIEGSWPSYRQLDRTRHVGGRRACVEFNPFNFPWPVINLYQHGNSVSLGFALGPSSGPDPLLELWLEIPRPGSS